MPVTRHLRRSSKSVRHQRKRLRARDGDDCHWCGRPMLFAGPDVPHNHPDRASLEHIISLADGGTYDDSNCALAHAACNYDRTPMAARMRAKLSPPSTKE